MITYIKTSHFYKNIAASDFTNMGYHSSARLQWTDWLECTMQQLQGTWKQNPLCRIIRLTSFSFCTRSPILFDLSLPCTLHLPFTPFFKSWRCSHKIISSTGSQEGQRAESCQAVLAKHSIPELLTAVPTLETKFISHICWLQCSSFCLYMYVKSNCTIIRSIQLIQFPPTTGLLFLGGYSYTRQQRAVG